MFNSSPPVNLKYCDELVDLMVDGEIFRVSKNLLSQSRLFLKVFGSYVGSKPVQLTDVSANEVECFLDILHARQTEAPLRMKMEGWGNALHLSTKWGFIAVREHIIKQIDAHYSNQEAMDRFELAMKCRVPQWLPSVYHTLCIRDKHITAEEGRKLGHERLTEICRIRELRPKLSIDERCGGCKACTTKLTSAHMTWPPCTAAIQVDVTKLITEATDLRANFPGEEVKGVEANADSVAKESMGQLPAIEDATTSVVLTPCPVQNEDAPKFILAKCLGCKRKLKRRSKWGMCKKCRD
ncbi:hypothetical protein FRB94_009964 [Tulasnella sp. JGI-2019a]|nr:hypothetical protein FRB94_009964 [Tulasnella sp. JGI-2019a]